MPKLTLTELEEMIETHSPEEIRSLHGRRLSEEGLAFLADFEAWSKRLEGFDEKLEEWQPAPEGPAMQRGSWWTRHWRVPHRWLPAVAALVLPLFLWPFFLNRPIGKPSAGPEFAELLTTRGMDEEDTQLAEINQALYDALLARGNYFYQTGAKNDDHFHIAYEHFRQAHALKPKEREVLESLVITCETLGLKEEATAYRRALASLNREKP